MQAPKIQTAPNYPDAPLPEEIALLYFHDIISPLRHLHQLATEIEKKLKEDKPDLNDLHRLARLNTATLSGILALSKETVDWLALRPNRAQRPTVFHLGNLLENVAALYAAHAYRIEINSADVRLTIDANILQAILRNLLDNAIKYSTGTIRITSSFTQNILAIEIANDAPADNREQELRLAGRDDTKETHLGYHFISRLTDMLQGKLDIATNERSTNVTLTIPLSI